MYDLSLLRRRGQVRSDKDDTTEKSSSRSETHLTEANLNLTVVEDRETTDKDGSKGGTGGKVRHMQKKAYARQVTVQTVKKRDNG